MLVFPGAILFASDHWKCVKEKKGITIFSKKARDSKYNQFKSVTVINAPFDVIVDTLRDFNAYPLWQPFMEEMKILENQGNDHVVAYASFDFPWPVSNRELLVETTIVKNGMLPSTLKIIVEGIDFPPANRKKKYIRIKFYRCETLIEAIGEIRSRITFTLESDPGGNLPPATANWAMREAIYLAPKNLREIIREHVCNNTDQK